MQLTGASVEDWEATAVGPWGTGSCLYIGDIGENNADRQRITIYSLREPETTTGMTTVSDVFHATYDDRHRLAFRRIAIPPAEYIVAVGADLEPIDEELEFLRELRRLAVPSSRGRASPLSWRWLIARGASAWKT